MISFVTIIFGIEYKHFRYEVLRERPEKLN